MGTLTDYFEARATKPEYELGDRVYGHFQGILYIGTTGFARTVDLERGVEVPVLLDLPLKIDGKVYNLLLVKPKDIKRLKNYE